LIASSAALRLSRYVHAIVIRLRLLLINDKITVLLKLR